MSVTLVRLPAAADRPALEVILATTDAEIRAAQHLRWQIYVRDMKIVDPANPWVVGERLVDDYDAWSRHLVLLADGVPAGSLRLTEARDGRLEIEDFVDLGDFIQDREGLVEPSRFMLRRDLRRGAAGPLLMHAAYGLIRRAGGRRVVAAGKLGNLGRYYQNVGLERLPAAPFVHGATGCRYELLAMDLGAPRSLRRLRWAAAVAALAVMAFHLQPLFAAVARRGVPHPRRGGGGRRRGLPARRGGGGRARGGVRLSRRGSPAGPPGGCPAPRRCGPSPRA